MSKNTYFNRLLTWFIKGKYLFLFLLSLILPLVFVQFEINDTGIKFYGLLLQMFGIIPLIISLKERSLLFGKGTFFKSLFNYFRSFPIKGKSITLELSDVLQGQSLMSADLTVKIPPKEELKDIIRYFQNEINLIYERISKDKNELNMRIQDLSQDIKTLKETAYNTIQKLENKVLIANVSNISRDYFGLFSLLYGLVLSTFPDLIEKFYSSLFV